MFDIDNVRKQIKKEHCNDKNQLDIIFDESKNIIVESPAGCGKTKTMISKIAYMLSMNSIESTKKVLVLTFSVNAAYKIKKNVFEQLPNITGCTQEESMYISNKIQVSNYHSFSKRIINLHGKNIIEADLDFNTLIPIDDSNSKTLCSDYNLNIDAASFLSEFNKALKECNTGFIDRNWCEYNQVVKEQLIPKGYITYNSIILLAYELFINFPGIKYFYNNYFPIIFVDEFQDTNYIAWKLLKENICEKTKILFMGDPLQRIYGFIGAIPNLMDLAQKEYSMKKYELSTNYRFKDNREMLLLDNNIRANAQELNNDNIVETANPNIIVAPNQREEAKWICDKVREIRRKGDRVAILVRAGASNKNTKCIMDELNNEKIPFFFALFTDNDPIYDKFHEVCLIEFNQLIDEKEVVTLSILKKLQENVKKYYRDCLDDVTVSLIKLLEIFCNRIPEEYNRFKNEEVISLIQDTFINKGLKQNMDKVEDDVILATIHAFKGLEYPYIIIADNEQYSFPNFWGACQQCDERNRNLPCIKRHISDDEEKYYEELSVFYVGFTRGIKKVYFTLSKKRLTSYGREQYVKPSCFLSLKGISYKNLVEL